MIMAEFYLNEQYIRNLEDFQMQLWTKNGDREKWEHLTISMNQYYEMWLSTSFGHHNRTTDRKERVCIKCPCDEGGQCISMHILVKQIVRENRKGGRYHLKRKENTLIVTQAYSDDFVFQATLTNKGKGELDLVDCKKLKSRGSNSKRSAITISR